MFELNQLRRMCEELNLPLTERDKRVSIVIEDKESFIDFICAMESPKIVIEVNYK